MRSYSFRKETEGKKLWSQVGNVCWQLVCLESNTFDICKDPLLDGSVLSAGSTAGGRNWEAKKKLFSPLGLQMFYITCLHDMQYDSYALLLSLFLYIMKSARLLRNIFFNNFFFIIFKKSFPEGSWELVLNLMWLLFSFLCLPFLFCHSLDKKLSTCPPLISTLCSCMVCSFSSISGTVNAGIQTL